MVSLSEECWAVKDHFCLCMMVRYDRLFVKVVLP